MAPARLRWAPGPRTGPGSGRGARGASPGLTDAVAAAVAPRRSPPQPRSHLLAGQGQEERDDRPHEELAHLVHSAPSTWHELQCSMWFSVAVRSRRLRPSRTYAPSIDRWGSHCGRGEIRRRAWR